MRRTLIDYDNVDALPGQAPLPSAGFLKRRGTISVAEQDLIDVCRTEIFRSDTETSAPTKTVFVHRDRAPFYLCHRLP